MKKPGVAPITLRRLRAGLVLSALCACGTSEQPAADAPSGEVSTTVLSHWKIDSAVSPVDGSIRRTAFVHDPNDYLTTLNLGCDRGRADVSLVVLGGSISPTTDGFTTVRYRLSGQEPQVDSWMLRRANHVASPTDARHFLDRLLVADTLHMEVAGTMPFTFVIRGASQSFRCP